MTLQERLTEKLWQHYVDNIEQGKYFDANVIVQELLVEVSKEHPSEIAIIIKGGCCQAVYANHPVNVIMLDYDNYQAGDEWTEEQEKMLELIKNKQLKEVY